MDDARVRALVRSILEQPHEHAWTLQDIGLLGLWLDDRRERRLHVWGPAFAVGDPPIHDHPFDFRSTVLAGAITNTRYEVSDDGVEYRRTRYPPADEDARRTDRVRLVASAVTHHAGDSYTQLAHELHASVQVAGTVTVLRPGSRDERELTVCQRPGAPWVSGRARRATADEVRTITGLALDLLVSVGVPALSPP